MSELPQNCQINKEQQKQGGKESDCMITLQGSLVNKLVKRILKEKTISAEFKKQFSVALSIFILYVQNEQAKKKYTKQDILVFLEKQGFGRIAQDLRKQRKCERDEASTRKKAAESLGFSK